MNADVDLDTRLRLAGSSLRRSVAEVPVDAPPPPGPDRRPLLAAAAMVLVLAALAAVAVALRDDSADDVSTDPDVVPRLVLGEPIEGLPATGAIDLPYTTEVPAGVVMPSMAIGLYEVTPPDGDGPIELGVMVIPGEGSPGLDEGAGLQVDVRDGRGWFADNGDDGITLGWVEDGDWVTLIAEDPALGQDRLGAMADSGRRVGKQFVPGPAAAGEDAPEEVGTIDDADLATGIGLPKSAVGSTVGYQDEGEIGRTVIVTTFAASAEEIAVVRWTAQLDTSTEVRGHAAWMGTDTFASSSSGSGSESSDGEVTVDEETEATESTGTTLLWEEAPGVYVVVQGMGLDEDQVRAAAEGLRPAGDAEWGDLQDRSESATPEEATVSVEGEHAGGSWSVYVDEEGNLCTGVRTASDEVGSCGGPGRAQVLTDDDGIPLAVYGELPTGAATIEVVGPEGLEAPMLAEADGRTIYAVALPGDQVPTEVVFSDGDGREVERAPVSEGMAIATTSG